MMTQKLAFPLFGVLAVLTIGCGDNGRVSRHDHDRDGIADRVDPHPSRPDVRGGEDIVVVDRARDRDWDRTHHGLDEVPRAAVRVGVRDNDGPGMRVRPNRNGRIFVYSEEADRVIYSGKLHPHEEFVAEPLRGEVAIDGRPLKEVRFHRGDHYRLYWLPD